MGSFSFPNEDHLLLQDISIVLKRGTVVALTGQNGSGKSTLATVLAGLYSPKSGKILAEITSSEDKSMSTKHDFVTEFDRPNQASVVQIVPQQPALFNTSIIENVRYSCPQASNSKVSEAL